MTAGHVLVAVGLGLNIAATLFLSLDALQSQRESNALLNVQALMLQNVILYATAPEFFKYRPLYEKQKDALRKVDSEIRAYATMTEQTFRFERRYPLIRLAIGSVLLGGVLELFGAVFLSA